MHVIVRDDLVDHDYVAQHTSGFGELVEHVRDWTPERAAAECGVDGDDIERFAREYATTTPAFIRTLIGAEHRESGAQFFRTVSLLPALIGAWKHRGGGFARSVGSYSRDSVDISKFAAPHLAGGRPRRSISMNRLGRALLDETLDPPIQAVFVWNGNPVVTAPEASMLRRGLSRPDVFTVVSEQFLTDTARYADVIFPACTQIEQEDVVPAWGHLYLGWNHRAIEPLGESVPNTELWRRLARAMNFTEPELFASDEELLATCIRGVDVEELKTRGWARLPLPDDLRPFAEGFPFPDGRLPFANADLERQGHGRLPTYRRASQGAIDDRGRYPLSLMSPKFHQRFLNSSYSHLEAHVGPEGELFCELHPDDASARAIADGDHVVVFNDRARLRAVARVSESTRVRPGLVIVPFGWVGDRTHDGSTVNDLTNDTASDWGGGVAFYDTSVEVERTAS
jgi:anaerobic selenocysteine-containing dehydrogenase